MMHKQLYIFILLLFMSQLAIGQCPPDSLNMLLNSRYDDDNMPTSSGVAYNDVWGYVDPQGNEYAIVGNVDSIFVFDVTNPDVIEKIIAHKAQYRCLWRDFKTYENYLYASSDNCGEGLLIFDLSDLPNSMPLVFNSIVPFVNAHNIYIDENAGRLYGVGTSSNGAREGFVIMDLAADPENPPIIKKINLDTLPGEDPSKFYYIHDVFVRHDTAYASHGYLGYFIWDVANVENIHKVASFEELPNAGNLSYVHSSWNTDDNKYAYIATEIGDRKIYVINQSDFVSGITIDETWKEPLLTCQSQTNSVPHNPYVRDGLLYVSHYQDGVQILDISNPLDPIRVGYYDTDTDNTVYNGTTGNWGVYPYLPSKTILATDTKNGLFVLSLAGVLPLDLLSFDVRANQLNANESSLHWEVSNAKEVEKFEIQHSTDGINFKKIGDVDYLEDIYNYNYIHKSPQKGLNYYRLKIVDYDSRFEYSSIESILFNNQGAIQLFPNPVESTLRIQCYVEDYYKLDVISQTGSVVLSSSSNEQNNLLELDVKDLPAGVYYARINTSSSQWWEKFIKL